MNRRVIVPIAALVVMALVALGCSEKKTPAVRIGQSAPAARLSDASGVAVDFPAAYSGKVVAILFWNEGCTYCQKEMPLIEPIYEAYRERGFEFVGIHMGPGKNAIEDAVAKHSLTFPMLMDEGKDTAKSYGIVAVPSMFLLDRQGLVREKILGGLPAEDLRKLVEESL